MVLFDSGGTITSIHERVLLTEVTQWIGTNQIFTTLAGEFQSNRQDLLEEIVLPECKATKVVNSTMTASSIQKEFIFKVVLVRISKVFWPVVQWLFLVTILTLFSQYTDFFLFTILTLFSQYTNSFLIIILTLFSQYSDFQNTSKILDRRF